MSSMVVWGYAWLVSKVIVSLFGPFWEQVFCEQVLATPLFDGIILTILNLNNNIIKNIMYVN